MQIQRGRSRLTFRTRRRRSGCLPTAMLILVVAGVVVGSWDWLTARLSLRPLSQLTAELRAAQAAFDRGDLDTAITLARQIWTVDPTQTDALVLLVRALIYRSYSDYDRDSDRQLALALTTEAFGRLTESTDVRVIHALALQSNGSYLPAARIADEVLKAAPENALARVVLALAYSSAGGHDRALSEIQRTANNTAWTLDVERTLGITYAALGMYPQAEDAVERALAINNRLLLLHFEYAQYALQQGDDDAATVAYFRILAFDPDNVKARLRLCELSSMLRERDTALRYCQEVTQAAPTWADGWYRLGREYFLQGDYANAQASLNRCSTLQVLQDVPILERRFECWYLQGQAAEILGDCEGLLATYNEFRAMAASAALPQTWTYPPEGPSFCATGQ